MSITGVLNTAKDALLSQSSAINITGNNIANVGTPGYSRLSPVFTSLGVTQSKNADVQIGVTVTPMRIYDQFIERQIIQQQQGVSYDESRNGLLARIETIFTESGGSGLNEAMSVFWNAWSALSANPAEATQRDVLVSAAENLASLFRQKAQELESVRQDVNVSLADEISRLNSCLHDIASLNEQILQVVNSGGQAGTLLDKRTESLKLLSTMIDFNYIEDKYGTINIYISGGLSLLQGRNVKELGVQPNPANNAVYDIVFKDNTSESINEFITSGRLAAYLEIRDVTAAGYLDRLNTLATTLVNEVNSLHQNGYDSYGNAGGLFFETVTKASNMKVSEDVSSNPGKIAYSSTLNLDGNNAAAIASIKDRLLLENYSTTLSGYYSSLMARVGQDACAVRQSLDCRTSIINQLKTQREAVSGVSIDEEMINLMKYQLGYNAAAKLVNTVDEMFDTLLQLTK